MKHRVVETTAWQDDASSDCVFRQLERRPPSVLWTPMAWRFQLRVLRFTPASGLVLATILFILLLVLASTAHAAGTPLTREMATTGRKFCRVLPHRVARSACFALQNEVATGAWIFGWQVSQDNEATMADWHYVPLRIRQNYAREMLALAQTYFQGRPWRYGEPPRPDSSVQFYDDNAWVGKSFIDAYKMSHLQAMRVAANGIMHFEATGWASHKGGMYWNTRRQVRVSDATAGAIGLALMTDKMNGNNRWVPFARKAYAWMDTTLGLPNHLYHQRLFQGLPVSMANLNVEGMMIQDGWMLSKATGIHAYSAQASATRAAVNSRYTLAVMEGICPVYTGQYFYAVHKTSVLSAYANWLASKAINGVVPIPLTWGFAHGTNAQAGTAWLLIHRILVTHFPPIRKSL